MDSELIRLGGWEGSLAGDCRFVVRRMVAVL